MRNPFSRLFRSVTVDVCAGCEGGSGSFYDAATGELTRCSICAGSGLLAETTHATAVVDLSLARAARAKEQRKAA